MKIKYQGDTIASVFSLVNENAIEQIIKNHIGSEIDNSLIELEPETEQERIDLIRKDIDLSGDTKSLLGTVSDNANLLLVEFSKLIMALDSVASIEDVKSAATSFKTSAEFILNKIDSKECSFPYVEKGQDNVLLEIAQRATGVNKAIFSDF